LQSHGIPHRTALRRSLGIGDLGAD
jgi:hypothetical protein